MSQSKTPTGFSLADTSLPLRMLVAVFLSSVGIGYLSALVNLHFQEASPGNPLPDAADVIRAYHGEEGTNQIARLVTAPDSLPFSGSGSMKGAFTEKRNAGAIKTAAEEILAQLKEGGYREDPSLRPFITVAVRQFLDFERRALLAWAIGGHPRTSYDNDNFDLPPEMALEYRSFRKSLVEKLTPLRPVPPGDSVDPGVLSVNDFLSMDDDGKAVSSRIRGIIDERCARCHDLGKSVGAYPLSRFEHLKVYLEDDFGAEKGKSLQKLALTSHVHLLGFSVLYGLTGLTFALSSYSFWVRLLVAPAPLVFQIVDISFWWMARLDSPWGPLFAQGIMATGGMVAIGLCCQIVLGLFGLFRGFERKVLLAVLGIGAAFGFAILVLVVVPHLAREKSMSPDQVIPITGKR